MDFGALDAAASAPSPEKKVEDDLFADLGLDDTPKGGLDLA